METEIVNRIQPQFPIDFCGLAIVGESPGRIEIEQGIPFVGRSGALLDMVLTEVGIDRSRCLVTNVFLSRPDNDKIDLFFRPPHIDGDGVAADQTFINRYGLYRGKTVCDANRHDMERLDAEFAQHRPRVILCLGATALWRITTLNGITDNRGEWSLLNRFNHLVGVLATYHPSFILRQRNKLSEFVSDIKSVKDVLDGING